jgi:hypothetical protein
MLAPVTSPVTLPPTVIGAEPLPVLLLEPPPQAVSSESAMYTSGSRTDRINEFILQARKTIPSANATQHCQSIA